MIAITEDAQGAADVTYMRRALELARRGLYTTHPNPRVGCVIVREGRIVAEGWHARAGEAHAELAALRAAGENARGATLYVTLEPCCHQGRTPPCTDALLASGVKRVVTAMEDPNPRVAGGGLRRLREAGVEIQQGLMEAEALALNPGFVSRMKRGRPHVRVKLAMSLDGRTAAANGESRWITGEAARKDVHRLRAEAGAVLTGIGTVLADDPSLNVRLAGDWAPPVRVVLDSRLRMPPGSRMLRLAGRTLVLCGGGGDAGARRALEAAGAEIHDVAPSQGGIDLAQALSLLGNQQLNEVLVEAGPVLAGALLRARLADQLILYVAPILLGDQAPGVVHLPDLRTLAQKLALKIDEVRAMGDDWRIIARPAYSPS